MLARVTDVSLDTIRTVAVVQGRRGFAAALGFFEAVVYICAVAKVLLNMDHPVYALAYGLGYASGTFLGITIEQRLAFGDQLASLVTRKGFELAKSLRLAGYRVAEVKGHTGEGDLTILYVEIPRRNSQRLIHDAIAIDANCFCILNDVRVPHLALAAKTSITPKVFQSSSKRGI